MAKRRFCQQCRVEIPAERIEALPKTRMCRDCSQAVGGEFKLKIEQTKLSKENSLKKNYGDVVVRQVRKRIDKS